MQVTIKDLRHLIREELRRVKYIQIGDVVDVDVDVQDGVLETSREANSLVMNETTWIAKN